ncbi:MAG: transporter substrate-binding domain-containing protein [Bacteroidota bacterium]
MNALQYIRFASLFLLFSLTSVSACKEEGGMMQQNESDNGDRSPVQLDLAQIQERDTLVAILNNSSTGYFIYRGQPMGYEYELLTRLAEAMDIELDIKLTNRVDEAIQMLNSGEGDIIAFNMAVTAQYKERVAFTEHHNEVKQVLIQRKPPNWRQRKRHEIEEYLIRNPLALDSKEVWVPKNSAYATRLENLSEEIGGNIKIMEKDADSEALIRMVADGEVDFTVAKEDVALVNATYYPIIDASTPVSFPQKIAWATRTNAPQLLEAVNAWIRGMKEEADYYVIYNKYYKSPKATLRRVRSDYSSLSGNTISPYDDAIKQASDSLGWDWRLLAAQAYQESKFDAQAKSWAGAVGLMQLMPDTGKMYGVDNMLDPEESLQAAATYLAWLDKIWTKYVPDEQERIKFVLASYNAGQGHVLDARRLARKYDKNPSVWADVSEFLLLKSKLEYYNDPVVKSGYVRGAEPVNYVREILNRYERYKQLVGDDSAMASINA